MQAIPDDKRLQDCKSLLAQVVWQPLPQPTGLICQRLAMHARSRHGYSPHRGDSGNFPATTSNFKLLRGSAAPTSLLRNARTIATKRPQRTLACRGASLSIGTKVNLSLLQSRKTGQAHRVPSRSTVRLVAFDADLAASAGCTSPMSRISQKQSLMIVPNPQRRVMTCQRRSGDARGGLQSKRQCSALQS